MARSVTIANGKSNVLLPNGLRYNAGAAVVLSDDEYSLLTSSFKGTYLSGDSSVSQTQNWFNVRSPQFGAAGNGTTNDTAALNAAWSAAISAGGGTVYLPAGNYKTTLTFGGNVNGAPVTIWADPGAKISFYGSGDAVRMYDASAYGEPPRNYGWKPGIYGSLVIDGANSSASAASTGLHLGDIFQPNVYCSVMNFANFAGSIGFHFDNTVYWTEQLKGQIYVENCVQHVVFDVSGASTSTASFARPDLYIGINQVNPAYDGIVVQNGALIYDGELACRGNFVGSASALTSCALRVTGTVPGSHPGAGNFAGIYDTRLDFGLECAAAANTPKTMIFGANSNLIKNCYGILDFGGDGAGANFTSTARIGNVVPFTGIINGDSVLMFGAQGLAPAGSTWAATGGFALGDFSAATPISSSGTISTGKAMTRVSETGNVTGMILGAGSYDGQTFWLVNTSNFTITFAASGTSHVADGASDVVPALCARAFIFEGNVTNLWYRCA